MYRIASTLIAAMLLVSLSDSCCAQNTKSASAKPVAMGYVLQADALNSDKSKAIAQLRNSGRDWIVLDRFFTGENPWTKQDLDAIRKGKPGRKVIAYLSIGEAEDYRHYWQESWTKSPPEFLLGENPDWKGNFTVRFWSPKWQEIILQDVRQITKLGFDGLYLDKVDVFELFEHDKKNDDWIDNRPNPETKNTYREDMIAWVRKVGEEMRKVNKKAMLIPQNASQLLEKPKYAKMINAIGVEDLFTDGEKKQPNEDRDYLVAFLKQAKAARISVLCIEYCQEKKLQAFATERAKKLGFNLLFTDRELKTLGQVPALKAK